MADEFVVVLSTFPSKGDVAALARTLVGERLAACVNIVPNIASVYRWDGRVEEDAEHQMIVKTARARLPALWERLRTLHPYDTPEFIVLPVIDGSDAYLKWIGESVTAGD